MWVREGGHKEGAFSRDVRVEGGGASKRGAKSVGRRVAEKHLGMGHGGQRRSRIKGGGLKGGLRRLITVQKRSFGEGRGYCPNLSTEQPLSGRLTEVVD